MNWDSHLEQKKKKILVFNKNYNNLFVQKGGLYSEVNTNCYTKSLTICVHFKLNISIIFALFILILFTILILHYLYA